MEDDQNRAFAGENTNGGYQAMIDAENVDEFVHSQTTRTSDKFKKDMDELNEDEKRIYSFLDNGERNLFMNVARYDEVLDISDKDFYVHANTLKSPYGQFILAQAPLSNTINDHFNLIWLYNVRTIVCLVPFEEAGNYFSNVPGGTVNAFMKFSMKTIQVYDVKQGITIMQCEFKKYNEPSETNKRMIYFIICPTPVNGVRNSRMHSVAIEYMWSFEDTLTMEGIPTSSILVHGQSGTRRTAAFVAYAIMCKQVLETGKFSAMDTWVEIRKRRACTCRQEDFYSSLMMLFDFCAQCGIWSLSDPNYVSFRTTITEILKKTEKPADAKPAAGAAGAGAASAMTGSTM